MIGEHTTKEIVNVENTCKHFLFPYVQVLRNVFKSIYLLSKKILKHRNAKKDQEKLPPLSLSVSPKSLHASFLTHLPHQFPAETVS